MTLEELAEKRREANRKILKSMGSRPRVCFQGILSDVGDGHIRMYCTLTDVNTTITCILFMTIYMCNTGIHIFYLSSRLLWLPSYAS